MALLLIATCPLFQINETIKDSFRNDLQIKVAVLAEAGPTIAPCYPALGTAWHDLLKESIKGEEMTE